MAEIFSLTLRTVSCLLEAAAVASTVGYATNDATRNSLVEWFMLQQTTLQRKNATTKGFRQ